MRKVQCTTIHFRLPEGLRMVTTVHLGKNQTPMHSVIFLFHGATK